MKCYERMSKIQSADFVQAMFLYFKLEDKEAPTLKFTRRAPNRGLYSRGVIKVGKETELWVLVHEFAHHLDRLVNGRVSHSQAFYHNLRRVIEATRTVWATDYHHPWNKEYRSLQKRAKKSEVFVSVPRDKAEQLELITQ